MRTPDPIARWLGGMNSLMEPSSIRRDQYAWGENVINRGGIVQSRPGLAFNASIAGLILQGMTIFTPKNNFPIMLVAASGIIWQSHYPFKSFSKIEGISFSSTAKIVTFATCLKSAMRNPDQSLSIIDPYALVVMQDGSGRAAYYDGVVARHLDASKPASETPSGLWMAWASSRLWVAKGSQIVVSDIGDPLSFQENTYIAEQSNFQLSGECTGIVASDDQRSLLAFTENDTTAFQAHIHNRVAWQTTPDFQKVILPGIGCVAGRSCVNQYGLTHWFSRHGFINLDSAFSSLHSSQIITSDGEMTRSKRNLSPDLGGICAAAFENLILVSVPGESKYNAQTWVLDQSPTGEGGQAPRAWAGAWSGFRPAQWASCSLAGRQRIYAACFDATARDGSQIHIWEAMRDTREDNGNPVKSQVEFATLIETGDYRKFSYAEIELCEIYGDVNLKVFFRGIRGPWLEVLAVNLKAERGCFGSPLLPFIEIDSVIQAFKPQSRNIRTRDFNPQDIDPLPESEFTAGNDKGFGLLFEWEGQMGIKEIKIVTSDTPNKKVGEPGEDETEIRGINESGIEVVAAT